MPVLNDNDLEVTVQVKEDSKAIKNTTDKIETFEDKIGKAEKRLSSFNTAFRSMAAAGALATGAMALGVKAAVDYEDAFAGIRKTMDESEENFAKISDNIRGMAKEIPVAATELAGIGEIAGQLGVRGVDNVTKFIRTVADISATTNLTSEAAATDFARIAAVMGEPIENIDKMASAVVALGNNFETNESEILNFASRIAGAGKIAGLASSDIYAIGAAMSAVGIEAEAGGTAVQKVLIAMNEAVVTGNDQLELFAATTGQTAEQFSKAWEEDPIEAFTTFVNGLGVAGDDAIRVLDDLELKDQRLVRAFLSLAGAGDKLNETVKISGEAFEENSALAEEAAKRYETVASQWQTFKNNVNDMAISLGEIFLPAINQTFEALKPLIDRTQNFIEQHPTFTGGILGITAAIGGIGVAGLTLIPALFNWMKLLGFINTNTLVLFGSTQSLSGLLFGTTIPILGMSAGSFGLLIAALWLAFEAGKRFELAWEDNMWNMRVHTENAINFVIDKINEAIGWLNNLIQGIASVSGLAIPLIPTANRVDYTADLRATPQPIRQSTQMDYLNYTPAYQSIPYPMSFAPAQELSYTPVPQPIQPGPMSSQNMSMSQPNMSIVQNNNIYDSVDVDMVLREISSTISKQ